MIWTKKRVIYASYIWKKAFCKIIIIKTKKTQTCTKLWAFLLWIVAIFIEKLAVSCEQFVFRNFFMVWRVVNCWVVCSQWNENLVSYYFFDLFSMEGIVDRDTYLTCTNFRGCRLINYWFCFVMQKHVLWQFNVSHVVWLWSGIEKN